jgi:hypothetical protein
VSTIENLEKTIQADAIHDLPRGTRYLFAPVDKRAFGAAIGFTCALLLGIATAVNLLLPHPWMGLALLRNYFAGYTVSWAGVFIGAAWAFGVGFCAGWLLAFIRNLSLAISLFMLRSRADLDSTSDFLDHI